jgi:hypothetical protein
MAEKNKPSVGRIVRFTLKDGPSAGQERPALIVAADKKEPTTVTLQVFTDGDGSPGVADGLPGVFRQAAVPLTDKPTPGAWHWPAVD